jgi:hypothetical protein
VADSPETSALKGSSGRPSGRVGASLAVLAAVVLSGGEAHAQGVDAFGPYGGLERGVERSPQDYAFEVRLGRYLPNVDDEFSGATPFADTFGNSNRFLLGVELDWQAVRVPHFGSFGPGFGLGYTSASAGAPLADGTGRSQQETSLAVLPLYAVGVLRVDVLATDLKIPLVPYGKLGLGYALWWVDVGDDTAKVGSVSGKGASFGWQFALGGMLQLDFLDRQSSITLDTTVGVNHSYVFAEWYRSDLSGFGSGTMQVGDNTWMAGLAFEM